MLGKRFCGYKKDGSQLILSDKEIIENALEQESHYISFSYSNNMIGKIKKRLRLRDGLFGLCLMADAV